MPILSSTRHPLCTIWLSMCDIVHMLIGVPAATHGASIELLCRPACHHQTLVPASTAPRSRPCYRARTAAARGAITGAISDMHPDGGQQAQRVSSPEPPPPSTKRLLPTAAMACEDRALGGEPETRAASSCSHWSAVVENRKSSFESPARSNMHPRVSGLKSHGEPNLYTAPPVHHVALDDTLCTCSSVCPLRLMVTGES